MVMSPVTFLFIIIITIIKKSISPVELKKRRCRPDEYKGQGPQT